VLGSGRHRVNVKKLLWSRVPGSVVLEKNSYLVHEHGAQYTVEARKTCCNPRHMLVFDTIAQVRAYEIDHTKSSRPPARSRVKITTTTTTTSTKITREQAQWIWQRLQNRDDNDNGGKSRGKVRAIARDFAAYWGTSVSESCIYNIQYGIAWTSVTGKSKYNYTPYRKRVYLRHRMKHTLTHFCTLPVRKYVLLSERITWAEFTQFVRNFSCLLGPSVPINRD
jgi:hypothetical protein